MQRKDLIEKTTLIASQNFLSKVENTKVTREPSFFGTVCHIPNTHFYATKGAKKLVDLSSFIFFLACANRLSISFHGHFFHVDKPIASAPEPNIDQNLTQTKSFIT